MKFKGVHIVGMVILAIGTIELIWGATGNSPLPTFVTNSLTQPLDLVLIGVGGVMIFYL